jgi:hypothetical protein
MCPDYSAMIVEMDPNHINDEIRQLIDSWCSRRELRGLAALLPAFMANNDLTDGRDDLALALRSTSGNRLLPEDERERLNRLHLESDAAIRGRP